MPRFFRLASLLLIFFNVLLLFLLLFEQKVGLPIWFSPIGRLHPLLLHLPIGFAVFTVIIYIFKRDIEASTFKIIIKLLFTITALSTAIVAILGFFLSKEGGFDADLLLFHKVTGVLVSFSAYILLIFQEKIKLFTKSYGSLGLLGILAIAGHFGANITHGENYLLEAFIPKKQPKIFSENNTIYEAAIGPIFEAKCISCHNDNKIKGELNMSNISKLLKGGKHGAILIAGDALKSHMSQRINLAPEEKEHMPPANKPQLTVEEISLITAWINEGADFKKSIKNYLASSKTKQLALKMVNFKATQKPEKVYTYSFASESTLKEVNTPFCSVFQLGSNSPALQADFYVGKKFEKKTLENLNKVSEQLVILNLAKMPVNDEDLAIISKFTHLEKLNLNQTNITGKGIEQLKNCKSLNTISLAGTKISQENLAKILNISSLKEVFVWNTAIDENALTVLSKQFPKISFNDGGANKFNETLKLNPPILVNENYIFIKSLPIILKHTLKNVVIRYTLDGSEPDSNTTTIYEKPIVVTDFSTIKALATKESWYASQKVEYSFFKATYQPDSVYLLSKPNIKYTGFGGSTLSNLQKGPIENTTDKGWLGFSETDMIALFEFKNATPISNITISYLRKIDPYIMPPTSVEIWAGENKDKLKLLKKTSPKQAEKGDLNSNLSLNFKLKPGNYKFIKIVAKPIKMLPNWHGGKGKPGWLFVDEVFFN